MSEATRGNIIRIKNNIATFAVDGVPYDFPKQMMPEGIKLGDTILINKGKIELEKKYGELIK